MCTLGSHSLLMPFCGLRNFIRLLNARGIIAVGDKSATGVVCRALEALSKLGEGTRVTAKAFLKLMSESR